jgi:XTP/dITP diphosphohydrolase
MDVSGDTRFRETVSVVHEIRFVSSNEFKIAEAHAILGDYGVVVRPLTMKIEELQTEDTDRLARDKLLKAFDSVRKPVFVEHTGLHLAYLNDLPGGLTQIVWDRLKADRFSELFGTIEDTTARAETIVAYTDGMSVATFTGSVAGNIVSPPRGDRSFQWDCVFQPDGGTETFAEMGDRKNDVSMRKLALVEFAAHLAKPI